MNLNLSYNWLKEHLNTKLSAKELAKKITASGPTVDFVVEKKPDFEKVVVGEIIELGRHPQADKLSLCQVNVGAKILPIVCGAANIKAGQKVPVVLVGGRVGELAVKKAKIRGVASEGMMCSQKELGLGDDHTGIFILPSYLKIGLPLEKLMPLSDWIFNLEITANRPDTMSVLGVAREASAITGDKLNYHQSKPNLKILEKINLKVSVKETKSCPRYQAIVMTGVKVEPSPLWLQQRLLASGLRPINNLVDITNYVLLEFGQPMHVFDYDKIAGAAIIVRRAKPREKILALDGKNYELTKNDLVIADAKTPVAVAGVMGGQLSAVSEETKTIIFESANFQPLGVRQTSRRLGLYSESSNLFEKGLAPESTETALFRAIELAQELAAGRIASKIFDICSHHSQVKEIKLKPETVKRIMGVELKAEKIKNILQNLGFEVSGAQIMKVKVPWWRNLDIEGEHDLVEEIARIYGYDQLPAKLMASELPVNFDDNQEFFWERKIKDFLVSLNYNEIYNYSFTSEKLILNSSSLIDDHLKIDNPLTVDFEYLRRSLMPGLLQTAAENEPNFKTIKIFELNKVYEPLDNDLPLEKSRLALIAAGESQADNFFELKGVLTALAGKLNLSDLTFEPLQEKIDFWSPAQTVAIKLNNQLLGYLGVVNQRVLNKFGLKIQISALEIDFSSLIEFAQEDPVYRPLAKYPAVTLDLSIEIDRNILYREIVGAASAASPIIERISFLSVFEGEKIPAGKKALAIRFYYRDQNKTLSLTEAQKIHDQVVAALKKKYNIKVR